MGCDDALTPDTAMKAFQTVKAWVRDGKPGDADLPAVHAAAVTIRVDGRVVGRATAIAQSADAEPAVHAAASGAIAEARASMPRARDALVQDGAEADFWSRARLSIEFAGALVPMSVGTYDQADAEVRPGIEGVAARAGSNVELVFPEAMLSRGIGPGDALAFAITRAVGEPGVALREDPAGQPARLAETRAVRVYRFRTVHIAEPAAGGEAIFLDRCGRTVRDWPRSAADIREWAASMARHIQARRRPENGGVEYAGLYRPVTGSFDPPEPSPLEEIIAARALLAYASTPGTPDAPVARAAAIEILDAIAPRTAGNRAPADDAPSAGVWCCVLPQACAARGLDSSDEQTWPPAWRESYTRALATLGAAAANLDATPDEQRPVIAFALSRRAMERWPGAPTVTDAAAALDRLFAGTEPGRLASRMPWLGWGELCIPSPTLPAAPALREFRDVVYTHQLRAEAMDADHEDLSGGIVFTASRSPLPTWQTARVAGFLASALGDARLTDPGERVKEIARLTATLRFLRQLTADDACGFMYADADRAKGGVRAALWDQRQPLDATALSLIAACETLRVMDNAGPEHP